MVARGTNHRSVIAEVVLNAIALRILLPIVAGVSFAALCFAGAGQNHVIDIPGWSHSAGNTIGWGQEPTDIGTPGDILLLAFNLPALITLLPIVTIVVLDSLRDCAS